MNNVFDYWQQAKTELAKRDKVIGGIIKNYKGEMLTSKGDAFFTLARSIVGQQISVKAADSVWNKLSAGGEITRKRLLELSDVELRACGLSGQKIAYMRSLCEYFAVKRKFLHLNDDEVVAELTKIKGIGRWSAEMFLIFHLQRPDVLPLGDIGLQKAMFKHCFSGNKVSKTELESRAKVWQPYRSVATWYLWRSLDPVAVEY